MVAGCAPCFALVVLRGVAVVVVVVAVAVAVVVVVVLPPPLFFFCLLGWSSLRALLSTTPS